VQIQINSDQFIPIANWYQLVKGKIHRKNNARMLFCQDSILVPIGTNPNDLGKRKRKKENKERDNI